MTLEKNPVFNGIGITMADSHYLNKIDIGTDSLFLVQRFDLNYALYIDCCVDGDILRQLTLAYG